jgi:hypothetical protein
MANPTTNFGWVMPTSTDLVTDLPADFNVFGQGVDTSLQYLLGGTTGQVLSKTSNTNMAFTWITAEVGDITSVVAGTALSGGGTSGAVTLNFDYAVGNQAIENAQTGTTYTLVLADAGKMVTMTNASANTLTVPPNADVAFPVNTRLDIIQYGAGNTTIAAGSGVTIYSSGSKLKLSGQYSGASLWKKATNTWVLIGDLKA